MADDMTKPPGNRTDIPTITVTPKPTEKPGQYPYGHAPSHTYMSPDQIFGGPKVPNPANYTNPFGKTETAEETLRRMLPVPEPPPPVEIAPPPPPPPEQPVNPDSVEGGRQNASRPPFKDIVEQWLKPNPLNDYWQPTYHFRLFVAGDKDLVSSASKAGDNISQLLNSVNGDKITQVIIAETGVTGYNIKDVEITSVDSMNVLTRDQKATGFTMTITEPLGLSFLDAIAGAGTLLEVWDYTKMIFHLQLSFTGYDANGVFAGNPLAFPGYQNGGRWLWALTLMVIETKLNEGGGVYTLKFVTNETEALLDEKKALKPKQVVAPEGKTLGALFNDYAKKLTDAWKDEYGKDGNSRTIVKFIIKTHSIPFADSGKEDPAQFQLKPKVLDKNPIRGVKMEEKADGTPVLPVPPGMSVNDFILTAILSTEEGQRLAKDEPTAGQPDLSQNQTNAKMIRISKIFSIEPVEKREFAEKETGQYVKEITLHVTPRHYNGAILSRTQVDGAERDPKVQRGMVEDLGKNGFLRKRYEYIFTGLNTEVIDFDLSFNFAFQEPLPKAAGFRMNYLDEANHSRTKDPKPTVYSERLKFLQFKGADSSTPQQPNAVVAPPPPTLMPTPKTNASSFFASTVTGSMLSGNYGTGPNWGGGGAATVDPAKEIAVPNKDSGGKRIYIEHILSQLNQGKTNVLPISFTHGYLEFMHETGPGLNDQYLPDQPLAATVIVQKMTNNFMTITLTIRGDPYWLGQTNLERQLILQSGQPTHDPDALPNLITGNPNILIYFRFPVQLGDDFKPILKDSAVFNGVYQVTTIVHTFSEGSFKQVLTAIRNPLIDITAAFTTDPYAVASDRASSFVSDTPGGASDLPGGNVGSTPGTGNSNIAPSGGLPNSKTQQERAQESYDFWTKTKGYTPAAAGGMIAQEERESSFDWAAKGDLNTAKPVKGSFQWQQPRRDAILKGTGIDVWDSNTTHLQQLEAAAWEQSSAGPERRAGDMIRAAATGGAAGDAASRYYERPKEVEAEAQRRAARGQFWENHFNKPTTSATPAP